jgi:hypothetical protein
MQTTYDKFLKLRFRVMTTRPGRAGNPSKRRLTSGLQPPPEPYWLWTAIPASGLTNWSSAAAVTERDAGAERRIRPPR